MSTDLYPYARVGVDFAPTDTWDPSIAYGADGYDARQEDWVGALYPYVDEATGARRVLRGVKNTSAAPIAAAKLVATETGEANIDHVALADGSTPAVRARGVTLAQIPVGHCGFVVCQGNVTLTAAGFIAVDAALSCAASGDVDDIAAGAGLSRHIVGTSLDPGVASAGPFVGYVDVL